jgi:hypothetical protein
METLQKHRKTEIAAIRAAMSGNLEKAKSLTERAKKESEKFYRYHDQIGKYLIKSTGTDIETVGKIIAAKNNTVTLHPVEHKLVSKMEFHIGGFMANCSNNDDQEYSFNVDESKEFEITITKSMLKNGYSFSEKPMYFFDYKF